MQAFQNAMNKGWELNGLQFRDFGTPTHQTPQSRTASWLAATAVGGDGQGQQLQLQGQQLQPPPLEGDEDSNRQQQQQRGWGAAGSDGE